MKEIKNTLLIFKARWLEAAAIVGLSGVYPILSMLSRDVRNSNQTLSNTVIYLILVLVSFAVVIIQIMLFYGFQRSVYLFETRRNSLAELLKYGAYFFWRLIGFGIILAIAHFFLQWLISIPTAPFLCPDSTLFQRVKECPMVFAFHSSFASIVLIKPVLFISALIIVLDCKLFESFKFLKICRLPKAKEAVILYCVAILVSTFLWALGQNLISPQSTEYYLYTFASSVLRTLLSLMWAVLAIRYVASLELDYDRQIQPAALDDLTKTE